MEPRSTSSPEPAGDTTEGCAKGCLFIIAVIVVISVAAGAWTWYSERDLDDITMRGVVTVDESCAFSRTMLINGDSITLDNGATTPDGCEYRFVTTVKDRDTYTFETRGQDGITLRRSMIDTVGPDGDAELRVRLSW